MRGSAFGLLTCLSLSIALTGCGGGGGGTTTVPAESDAITENGTAQFLVDTASGKVKVLPLDAGKGKSAIIGGSGVTFETSELLTEGGEIGRRTIKVKLKNNLQEAIGGSRPIRISFGPLSNQPNYLTDLRSLNTVSTPIATVSGSVDGPVGQATINTPYGVAVGQDGTIYFSTIDSRIRALKNNYVSTVATNMPCSGITYVRDSASGREYIVGAGSTLHSIKSVNIASGSVTTLAGLDFTSGNVSGAAASARFNMPYDIQVEPGYGAAGVFNIADYGNNSVRTLAFTFSGGNLVAGTVANRYTGLSAPTGVSTATNKSVAVVENGGNRVRIFNNGSSKEALIGTGTAGDAVGSGHSAQFNSPVSVLAVGNSFIVTENTQIKRISLKAGAAPLRGENWLVSRVAGDPTISGTADGSGSNSRFDALRGLALEQSGALISAQLTNNSLRRIVTAGTFDFGTPDGSGTGGATLVNQTGDADLAGSYRPYIDVDQTVAPGQTVDIGEWQFSVPESVHFFTFVVQVEAPTASYAGLEAVSNPTVVGGPGSANVGISILSRRPLGYANGTIGNAQFTSSYGACSDAAGNIYFSEINNGTIRRIGVDGMVTTVAGSPGAGFVNGLGSVARFSGLYGLWCNSAGTVIVVADSNNAALRYVSRTSQSDPKNADSWTVSTIAGTGTSGDATGIGSTAQLKSPFGLATADGLTFFVTELIGNRVSQVTYVGSDPSSANSYRVSRLAGSTTGVAGYVNAAGTSARFDQPYGIAITRDHKILVSDYNNNRIRAINLDTSAVTDQVGDGAAATIDNDNALSASVGGSYVMAGDSVGAVYFGSYSVLRRYLNGGVKTVVGNNNGGGRTGANFAFPSAVGAICPMPGGDLVIFTDGGMVARVTRIMGNRP